MRPIDADALEEILTTAIRNMRGMAKFLGAEDDPEIKMEIKAYTDILEGVRKLPTVDADTGWILVEDKLPEEEQDVLATYIDNEETRIIPVNYARGTWFDCIFNYALNPLKVIAWCRLPKAYKPKEDK